MEQDSTCNLIHKKQTCKHWVQKIADDPDSHSIRCISQGNSALVVHISHHCILCCPSPAVVRRPPVKPIAEAPLVLQVQVPVPIHPLVDRQISSSQRQSPKQQGAADEEAWQLQQEQQQQAGAVAGSCPKSFQGEPPTLKTPAWAVQKQLQLSCAAAAAAAAAC
jgi:hypothetical protein